MNDRSDSGPLATSVPLTEAFHTIQGEGFHQGKPAFFIRLAGCDVGCHWCDVKESWDENDHPKTPVQDIVDMAIKYPTRMAVVTGGEPMHNLSKLCHELHEGGFRTHLETSGSHPLTGEWDWVCLSPKKFKTPLQEIYHRADELKVIIYNKSDFTWALDQAELVALNCQLFLQPEWDRSSKMLPQIIEFTRQRPSWRISLQVHKYMGVP